MHRHSKIKSLNFDNIILVIVTILDTSSKQKIKYKIYIAS